MTAGPLQILIVEDNPADAKLLEYELRRGGSAFESVRVETEPEFLAALTTEPDLVLCDWQLPQFDSLRALKLLHAGQPDIPFIVVSGSIGPDAAINMMKQGAADYLLKDRLDRLVPSVEQALEKRDIRRSLLRGTEALRLSESRLAEAQRIARLGSWGWEAVSGKVWWSDALFALFGLNPATAVAGLETFLSILHPDDRPTALSRVEKVLTSCRSDSSSSDPSAASDAINALFPDEDTFGHDFRVIRPDGIHMWIHSRARVVRDATGRTIRVEGTDQDITERKRLEDQFLQAQKMEAVGQLAGGIAHDFNNLLTVINGYADLLRSKLSSDDVGAQYTSSIQEAGERAAALTSQLLAFSRKTILAPRVLDVNEVLEHFGRMLHRLIGEDIKFSMNLFPRLSRVKADPGQLEQVLINLAVNARDAMPCGGRLTIETHEILLGTENQQSLELKPGSYVQIRITDTGTGIPGEIQSRMFEPFFTTKEVGKGTGLGLATVYGIVRQAGGSITVESVLGHGASFLILLPAISEEPTTDENQLSQPIAPQGSETILVVED